MKDLWTFKGGGATANQITLSGKSIVPPGTRCVIVDKAGKLVCSGTATLGSVKISMDPQALMTAGASFTLKALDEGEEYVEPSPPRLSPAQCDEFVRVLRDEPPVFADEVPPA